MGPSLSASMPITASLPAPAALPWWSFRRSGRGVSPLSVQGVTYVEDGRQNASNMPTAYEGTITVE